MVERSLSLMELDQEQIDVIVRMVPDGARNIQDVYPLSTVQEAMLVDHLLHEQKETYVLSALFELQSRELLDALIDGLQSAIDRHDALRTAVIWESLPRPVQVVCRHAVLCVEEIGLDANRDPVEQLTERTRSQMRTMDLRQPPLMRLLVAADPARGTWYALVQRHHLVFDHQSWHVVFSEAMASVQGRDPRAVAPEPYKDYVTWSLVNTGGPEADAFFRLKFADAEQTVAPFGVLEEQGGATHQMLEAQESIGAALTQRIRAQTQLRGVSAARLFHAAWALVVAKTTGRDDVTFGTVLSSVRRKRASSQRAGASVGLFINTLPLRLRLQDFTVEQLVAQTHRELKELQTHQSASLAQAQRCSGTAGAPLFTAVLNYRHSAGHSVVDPKSAPKGLRLLAQRYGSNHPIMVVVDDLDEDFTLTAQSDERIDPRRIAAYLKTSIDSLVSALEHTPQQLAMMLSILPEAERYELAEFNATAAAYSTGKLIHELFEEQVARTPQGVAIELDGQSLTYEQLNRHANCLANYLRGCGVGPECLVAICVERSPLMVIGLLGILKAGGAYVPLDPNYPAERLQHMLEDASPHMVLTQENLRDTVPATRTDVIALDTLLPQLALELIGNLPRGVQSSVHLVYVIYTSGTTGRPKGTAMEHRSMVNLIEWHRRTLPMHEGKRVLQFAALSFDVAFQEIFSTLCTGGTLVLLDEWVRRDTGALMELLTTGAVERLFVPPMMLQSLAEHFRNIDSPPRALREVITAGEQLRISPEIVDFFTAMEGCVLHNHYGPTETHVVTALTLTGEPQSWPALPTIGRPIANTQIHVLDSRLQPVPLGAVGEIYIGGANVARAYLNRPELTAERFREDPFSPVPWARMYKTGDLGRWRPDGTVEYLGRNDDQVKIRGFRVELREIETQLALHAQVREAVALAREDAPAQKRLVAYVTLRGEDKADVENLRRHLQAVLPDHMVPAAFVVLESLPLTPTGKLNRRALPPPDPGAYMTRQYEEPRGEVEQILASIWQDLLKVERVGRQDNFFQLGGHSLLLVQMMERLRRANLSASVRAIYESRSLAALGSTLTRLTGNEFEVPRNLIPAGCERITPQMLPLVKLEASQIERIARHVPGGVQNIQDIYALAPLQDGILFHHLLDEQGGDTYVVSMLFSLRSRQRLDEFIAALQGVIDRHDILRTAVLWEDLPQAVQVVYRKAILPVLEMTLCADRDAVEQIKEKMKPERQQMDVRRAPLLALQVATDRHSGQLYAVLQMHHLICDHESLDTMLGETLAHLNLSANTLPEPLPYRNHVAQALAHARTHDTETFFRAKLGDVEETTAPFGLVDVHGNGSRIDRLEQMLDPALSQRLRAQARALGVSAATLFHVGWALVLSHTTGRDDVVFGTVLLGRMQGNAGAHRVLGIFMNTLPLRLKLQGLTTRELTELTQRELVDLLGHEQASLAVAQRCSAMAGRTPLFTSLLNYRWSTVDLRSEFAAVGMDRLGIESYTNYPLTLSVLDRSDGFLLDLQTDRRVGVHQVFGYVTAALESVVTSLEQSPQKAALSLPIIPESERQQVIEAFNATDAAYPRDKSLQELFEQQAARAPDAVALIGEEERLTYAQLNGRANQLAGYLREQGVAPGNYVPVLMTRSLWMIVSQLAILKCGGVYVPVDPDLPRQRREFMVRDCNAPVIVCEGAPPTDLELENVQWVDCVRVADAIAKQPTDNLSLNLSRLPAAYVMYTSGSTGKPKGVVVSHHSVSRLVVNTDYARIEATDCLVHYSNPAFDASTLEIWGALLNGARVVVVPQSIVLEPQRFAQTLLRHGVTTLYMSVGLFNEYVDALADVFSRLRYLMVGGDALDPRTIRQLLQASPPQNLMNVYGPTEGTTYSTTYTIRSIEPNATSVPIGKPMSNTRIYILDQRWQPVGIGVTGELFIGGEGVAQGYLGRSELTAERFLPDPFSSDPHARMYKTGDLGRWRSDGVIEYLGRNDQQVKIRGYRIELDEIEGRLVQHSLVQDAVVVAREAGSAEKQLVAYIVPRDASRWPEPEDLRTHLQALLPHYMVPSAFVMLERLPITNNGKLDRAALPMPGLTAYAVRKYEPPVGAAEEAIAAIWRDLLHVERVGRTDNFFELGGHSLIAIGLLFKINQRLGSALRVMDIYRGPTVAELAARVRGAANEDEMVVLADESLLDEDIRAVIKAQPPQNVLLTGATGFVGRFLLAQLLQSTDATVYCLVRAHSDFEAAVRLKSVLSEWDLWNADFEQRIVAVPGNLGRPQLGIDAATYQLLCKRVDSIYHCGTSMNHLETYRMARQANVESARELLRLATHTRKKVINYVSTLSVFNVATANEHREVNERTSIDHERHWNTQGYSASKWVGEKIFMQANERGIPCNIFRLGLVWADSEQGRYDELQRNYRLLKSCLLSGAGIQDYRLEMSPTPVDYVARAIVFLAGRHPEGGGIFHIASPHQPTERVFERCNEIADALLELLPHYDWIQKIKRLHRRGHSLPIAPLIEFAFSLDESSFYEQRRARTGRIHFDCARTHEELERGGIVVAASSDELLQVCLEGMLSRDEQLQEWAERRNNPAFATAANSRVRGRA